MSARIRFPLWRCVIVAAVVLVDADHLLPEPEDDVQVAQVVAERLDDLGVAEVEQLGPGLDDRHPRSERREHRRVLDADHPRPDDQERIGDLLEVQDAVRVEHVRSLKSTLLGRAGRVPTAITIFSARDLAAHAVLVGDRHGVRIGELPLAGEDADVVSRELVADDVGLALDHSLRAPEEVRRW